MGYNIDPISADCYPGTSVLINKLNIRDEATLQEAEAVFTRLKAYNYFKDLAFDDFIEEIVDFYCVTNRLHPFREGNGRTQRSFLTQLIRNAGYDIHFSDMDADLLMIATIQSAQGVTDLLKQLFREQISLPL